MVTANDRAPPPQLTPAPGTTPSSVEAATSALPLCDSLRLFASLSGRPMYVKLWVLPALLPFWLPLLLLVSFYLCISLAPCVSLFAFVLPLHWPSLI